MTGGMGQLFSLGGKVALVTGGAGFLGTQHCHALAAFGARVVVVDILQEKAERLASVLAGQYKQAAFCYPCDVTDSLQVRQMMVYVCRSIGPISILVNNAALDPRPGALPKLGDLETDSEWSNNLAVGLASYYICSAVIGRQMYSEGGGVIVNIASDLSVIAPDQRLYRQGGEDSNSEFGQPVKPASYSALKHGVIGLTKWFASTYAPQVRVNALSPGGVYNHQPVEFVQRVEQLIPLRRMAREGELAGSLVYLCSDASSYTTGVNLVVDGGRHII